MYQPRMQPYVAVAVACLIASACPDTHGGSGGPRWPAVEVDLPRAASGTQLEAVLNVVITGTGETYVDGAQVPDDELVARARSAAAGQASVRVLIAADQAASHGRVVHVVDLLKRAGVGKVASAVAAAAP